MRRETSLTLRGALSILGRHEPKLIGTLDTLLGGVILTVGAVAGLAPLAAVAALWGWVDQKNEAMTLLRRAVGAASGHLARTKGYERRQLIVAAHTAIVVGAFFEVLREHVGAEFNKIRITESEKLILTTGHLPDHGESLLDALYTAEVPAPSPTGGFEENAEAVRFWMHLLAGRMRSFLSGLADEERLPRVEGVVVEMAEERYRSHYLKLASTVPEFAVWAMLGEHAATRTTIIGLRTDVAAALDAGRGALARIEALLGVTDGPPGVRSDLCAVVERANRGVLDQPMVPVDADRYGTDVVFPSVRNCYINPRYRIVRIDARSKPANETWWDNWASHDNLDLTLTGYVTAPDSTRLPLLLLGHPGAGKSLLTKVLAARLPAGSYTVVRVPLRRVGANAPIYVQIQQALDLATNQRVKWSDLVERSQGTVRVVLLDGLDELLQATSTGRSGYLQEIMDFQRVETEQDRPVVVMVTSRTVVADRVDIPDGTTVLKLDDFDEAQIEEWLGRWRQANSALIASGTVRELTASAASQHYELARQPLLLLMLTLYSADPAFPALDVNLSTADLYGRLLDNFARREVAKRARDKLRPDELDRGMRDQLDRLSVAAFAMFNRSRQDITEAELGKDLAALHSDLDQSWTAEQGQRLIGEFFFVHAAEAQPMIAAADPTWRCYEFLHATFGEYLVARRVIDELVDVADSAFAGRRGPREPSDDLLFALLSHTPLAVRRSTLAFAADLFAELSDVERSRILRVTETLLGSFRSRHRSGRYAAYRPVPADAVRQLAGYSANLVLLRVLLEPPGTTVPLARLCPGTDNALMQWRSTVTLWRSGLDGDGWTAMLATVARVGDTIRSVAPDTEIRPELSYVRLIGDPETEARFRLGYAYYDGVVRWDENDDWAQVMTSLRLSRSVDHGGRAAVRAG